MADFRLLGPVEVWAEGRPVPLGTVKQREVLAALMVDAGRPVSVPTLIERVWGGAPPDGARAVLYAHVSRIRTMLSSLPRDGAGRPAVTRRSGGYVAEFDAGSVDLHRFRTLVTAARDADDDHRRAAILHDAMRLWRGDPLGGLGSDWSARVRETLRQQRLDTLLAWAEAQLRTGGHRLVIDTLRPALADMPHVEPLAARLMAALQADGRTAEALDCYTTVRRQLAEDLGTDPGPELRRAHHEVLRGEASGTSAPPPDPGHPTPAQLPADFAGFTGRIGELARLDAMLDQQRAGPPGIRIVTVGGPPGIGKTALALHWAHRVAARFPDGQLYVNLRGFDPAGPPMQPHAAIRGFLAALGVPPEKIPDDADAQTGLYRSLLAGRQALIVLDNARDATQIAQLLPGSARCVVVVTSRRQLHGLVATGGAIPMTLDRLSRREAQQLLARRVGAQRVSAEPEAAEMIIRRCAGLPLALSVVAARAAMNPQFPLESLAAEVNRTGGLVTGDVSTDVRAVFSWSYRLLTAPAARLFRQLDTIIGPEIATSAVARMTTWGDAETAAALAELTQAYLITERLPGRFAFHDLLRAYAHELAERSEPPEDRRAALGRLLDHYLATAVQAARVLHPHRDSVDHIRSPRACAPIPDPAAAMEWFRTERPVLLAAVDVAAKHHFDEHAWKLVWAMATFLDRRGHWHDWLAAGGTALTSARRLGDRPAQAHVLRGLAAANVRLGRCRTGHTHLMTALDLFTSGGDRLGQAQVHNSLAWVCDSLGRHRDMLRHAELALTGYRDAGHLPGQARALNIIGWSHAVLGDHERCLRFCGEALTLLEELDDRVGQAATWDSLGYAHLHRGRPRDAVHAYQRGLALRTELADRHGEAKALANLGDAHHANGSPDSAHAAWRAALESFVELDDPEAETIRQRLAGGGPAPAHSVPAQPGDCA
ncbi:AfsR/SARP family transcriptional regulator [Catenuloplanes indicus]|uniref:DNA-binding SARP family transcriptional activator/tetratricopeptide (TPR) repeat protein n=1 Tax=Catenuloplanes indicus TaxID=137267 RepID=A0AAE3W7R6_9ACTN|nr:BTAD domain-containing putative transcriptional regulator [Catenuloplanes indicus]MDQ0371181.1 DNA-binding SARP family transcriptional activator/tetratricopeptide (TPR) repeat protein [Catenuloplanes indicus]